MISSLVGIIASSGVGASLGDYESISTTYLSSGSAASVSFTSIPSTYQHLQIRIISRDTTGSPWGNLLATGRFNSDSGSNYAFHRLYGTGASALATATTSTNRFTFLETASTETANAFSASVIDILDYKDTNKYKTVRALSGGDFNDANGEIDLIGGLWMSTSAITQIDLTPASGNWAQYSSFALYGIKG
jgi:hypothetical protein